MIIRIRKLINVSIFIYIYILAKKILENGRMNGTLPINFQLNEAEYILNKKRNINRKIHV